MSVLWMVSPAGEGIKVVRTSVEAVLESPEIIEKPCWIHMRGIEGDCEDLLRKVFRVNELSIEDCKSEARSKVEFFEEYIFVLVVYFDGGISRQKKLCVFWGKDFLITVGSRRLFEEARRNLALEESPFEEGMEKVMWVIVSLVADKFKVVTDILEEQTDEIEAKVFKEQNPELLEDISDLSFEIFLLRRSLKQLRETFSSLLKSGEIKNVHYFRDLYDEVSILFDRSETLHEFIQNVLSVFSSLVSFKLNDIMKTLTIFLAILEPLMFISSFYGMNVVGLPLASVSYGIFVISLLMIGTTLFLLYYFRKKGWL